METPSPTRFRAWPVDPHVRVMRGAVPPPEAAERAILLSACCNEFVSAQIAACSDRPMRGLRCRVSDLSGPSGARIPADAVRVRFVGYVECSGHGQVPDPLLERKTRSVPAGETQPIWLTIQVPPGAPPGFYAGRVVVLARGQGRVDIPLVLDVADVGLPNPRDFAFYLDLWQHPANIADQLGLERWSPEHWEAIRSYTRELARAGQKAITTTIIEDPWAGQTRVRHPSLVRWTGDGRTFAWDYTLFDRYVELCMEEGIDRAVSAYSMVLGPGRRDDCAIAYEDAATGEGKQVWTTVGTEEWAGIWRPFLRDFGEHLRWRGWYERTQMGFDEKPPEVMRAIVDLIRTEMPGLGLALAGDFHAEYSDAIRDYCVCYPGPEPSVADARRRAGQVTTLYTCCGPAFPNTFVHSPLVEPRMLPWIAAAGHADGYLRWAFTSWPEDPLRSPDYNLPGWPAGDTFLVYPGKDGPISSLRWEMLKQGVQDYELIAALRAELERRPDEAARAELEAALSLATRNPDGRTKDPDDLLRARRMVIEALRSVRR